MEKQEIAHGMPFGKPLTLNREDASQPDRRVNLALALVTLARDDPLSTLWHGANQELISDDLVQTYLPPAPK